MNDQKFIYDYTCDMLNYTFSTMLRNARLYFLYSKLAHQYYTQKDRYMMDSMWMRLRYMRELILSGKRGFIQEISILRGIDEKRAHRYLIKAIMDYHQYLQNMLIQCKVPQMHDVPSWMMIDKYMRIALPM